MESHSADELRTLAGVYLAGVSPREGAATILALSGDLGAGKTNFAQGIARALGIEEQVTSPTFVIENIYTLSGQRWRCLIHIDAYRLKDEHELEVLGWREIVGDPGNLILIEWPERVAGLIPKDAIRLTFEILQGDGRRVTQQGGV